MSMSMRSCKVEEYVKNARNVICTRAETTAENDDKNRQTNNDCRQIRPIFPECFSFVYFCSYNGCLKVKWCNFDHAVDMLLNADGHTFRNAHIIYTATPAKFSSTDDDNIKSRWKWIQKKKKRKKTTTTSRDLSGSFELNHLNYKSDFKRLLGIVFKSQWKWLVWGRFCLREFGYKCLLSACLHGVECQRMKSCRWPIGKGLPLWERTESRSRRWSNLFQLNSLQFNNISFSSLPVFIMFSGKRYLPSCLCLYCKMVRIRSYRVHANIHLISSVRRHVHNWWISGVSTQYLAIEVDA